MTSGLVGVGAFLAFLGVVGWVSRRAPLASATTFPELEAGLSFTIARRWHWIALLSGILLLCGFPDLEERLGGLGFVSAGIILLGARLYRHPSPAPQMTGPYTRPVGQMVIATIVNLALGVALAACGIAAGIFISARHPTSALLDTITLVGVILLFAFQALLIPIHGWWRWFEERDTIQIVAKLADELRRRQRNTSS